MFCLAIAISLVGVTYFAIQDKKEAKRKSAAH